MTALVLYELDPLVRARFGFDDVAVPVRKDRAWEIFQGQAVHLDRLLTEVEEVIAGDAELTGLYGPFLARLARVVGLEKGREGDFESAIQAFDTGLRHSPGSIRLWTAKAAALQALGRFLEAGSAFRRVAWHPDFDGSPVTLLLAAQAALDAGEPESALEYLRQCPADMLKDQGFRQLVEACGGMLPGPQTCPTCGREREEGFEFCPKCGASLDSL